jgi:hypothetical protein
MISMVCLARPLTTQVSSTRKRARHSVCVSDVVCACLAIGLPLALVTGLAITAAAQLSTAICELRFPVRL